MGKKFSKTLNFDKRAMTRQDIFYFVLAIVLIFVFNSISVIAELSLDALGSGSAPIKIADGVDCWLLGGNFTRCVAQSASCFWLNNSAAPLQDAWCPFNYTSYNTTGFSNIWVNGFNQLFINNMFRSKPIMK